MTTRAFINKCFYLSFILFFLTLNSVFADPIIDLENKYSLDIPEGFEVADYTEDGLSFLFTHPNFPVQFTIQVLQNQKNLNSEQGLKQQLTKLNSTYDIDTFLWNEQPCAIGSFSMSLGNEAYRGRGICTKLQNSSPIVIIAFAPDKVYEGCDQFVISILNSLCTNDLYYCKPGIIVSYAFPRNNSKSINVNFRGYKFKTQIDVDDEEAAQFVVDLEYSVLNLYGKHKNRKEAIQRYYRMIYRDNAGRLENFCSDLLDLLVAFPTVQKSEKPGLQAAQELLYWVQEFQYDRDLENSDFTNLVSAVSGKGNDCDSRSMLVSYILKAMDYESILLVSTEYGHAMTTLLMNEPGQKYHLTEANLDFLFGETTAKGLTWGMIAANQQDQSKWVPVIFP